MKISDGVGLMVIATLHELVGLVAGFSVTVDIARDGVVNALGEDWMRQALFWFHVSGAALFIVGEALRTLERATGSVPRRFGYLTVAIGLVGVVMLPASGFWLVLAWGARMVLRGRRVRA
ncbi:MAG: hypothetical protein H6719_07515 [Sandaracinaceae bacterium]|nr:hypothetical protein [Sandaracinaceae bacterium]